MSELPRKPDEISIMILIYPLQSSDPNPPPPTVWRGAGRGDLINLLYEHGRKKFTQEVQALGFQISMGNNFSVQCLEIMGNYL